MCQKRSDRIFVNFLNKNKMDDYQILCSSDMNKNEFCSVEFENTFSKYWFTGKFGNVNILLGQDKWLAISLAFLLFSRRKHVGFLPQGVFILYMNEYIQMVLVLDEIQG